MQNSVEIEIAKKNQGTNEHPCVVCGARFKKGDLILVMSRHSIPDRITGKVRSLINVKAHVHCVGEIIEQYPQQTLLT